MNITLSKTMILNKLSIDVRPRVTFDGFIEYEPNPDRQPYIVFDAHRDAPVGFGVKVSATKKTYVLQRRVASDRISTRESGKSRVIKAKVGNIEDFSSLEQARDAARLLAQTMMSTKRNPNAIRRELDAAELTLSEVFAQYRCHLTSRAKPAKPNTLAVFDKAENRLNEWRRYRIKDLSGAAILNKFDEIASRARTAAEQTFRWANVAVQHAIEIEAINAQTQQRVASLTYNPFTILSVQKKYRTRSELEESYREKNVRNPLSPRDTLKQFLDALYYKRFTNRLGADYLLVTILSGTRKEESASLCWRDELTDEEAKITNYTQVTSSC